MTKNHPSARGALLIAVTLLAAPALAADPPDGIDLTVVRGPGAADVTLTWVGGVAPYRVYRSATAGAITDLSSYLGDAAFANVWVDTPPAGKVFFYRVVMCTAGADCGSGFCAGGWCCDSACDAICEACDLAGSEGTCTFIPSGEDPADECPGSETCNGSGACGSEANGSPCADGGECQSGTCVDGVCCNSACDETCAACDLPGIEGTCTFVSPGQDPDSECGADAPATCGQTGECSGAGSCSLYPAGTVCVPASCADADTANPADLCDGNGACVASGPQECAPYLCDGGSGACDTLCTSCSDCSPGRVCDLQSFTCVAPGTVADAPDAAFVDSNCDGIDGDAGGAIFADALGGNDANPGTMAQPVRTLATAIGLASLAGKDVYTSRGTYLEQVNLASGVSLYGAYDAALGWSRAPGNTVTIAGSATQVRGVSLTQPLELQFVTIDAANATGAGASSYALLLQSCAALVTVTHSTLLAGAGSGGVAGSSGVAGASATAGGIGQPGCENSTFGCSTCAQPNGGGGGSSSCGRSGGVGGRPGLGDGAGLAGAAGVGPTAGGSGGFGGGGGNGGVGGIGAAGVAGSPGPGGLAFGSALPVGYLPAAGGTGFAATHGNGGGGGGGGGGGNDACDSYGSAGGGGGGGGCAGTAATGGGGGGGSFAVYLDAASVSISASQLTSDAGGSGGAGGTGGNGGNGGNAGAGGPYGGSGEQDDGGNGGAGGAGGAGGRGGHGGGGGGGPSIVIQCAGGSTATLGPGNVLTPGTGGNGGASAGNPGATGLAVAQNGC